MTSSPHQAAPGGDTDIPGVIAAEFDRAYREGRCDVPIGDRPELEAFFTSVLEYMQDWYAHRPSGEEVAGVVAFVFSRRPRKEIPQAVSEVERIHFFGSDFDRALSGNVFLAAAGIQDARRWSTGKRRVDEMAAHLLTIECGDRPAVLVDLATRQARLCRNGVDEEQSCFEYRIPHPSADLGVQGVDTFLDGFYEAFLNPNKDQAFPIWASSGHGVPLDHPEKRVQLQMLMAARLSFRGLCVCKPEVPTIAGRIDILIQPHDTPVESGVLLELKALRSKASIKNPESATAEQFRKARGYSDRKNEEEVVDGIDQANTYRPMVRAALAFLCCYDLRTNNTTALVDKLRPLAQSRKVELRHYPVFRDAKHWRRSQPGSAHAEWARQRSGEPDDDDSSSDGDESDE
jgi:hypothetical protein